MHLRYLTIEFGLGFFSFSLLFLSCLSSAQSGSHLTHSLLHMHSLGGSATEPAPKHPPHGHVQSPASSRHSLLRHPSSCPSSTRALTWPLAQTPHPRQGRARQLLSVHRETKRERWQWEKLWDVREKSGRVGGMRAKPEGGGVGGVGERGRSEHI